MTLPPLHTPGLKAKRPWLSLGMMAGAALLAGLALPQLMPSTHPRTPVKSESEPSGQRDKNDWTYVPPSWPEPPDHQAAFVRLGLGTAAVLTLCVATLWCGKRWLRGETPVAAAGAQLSFIESLPLGNRCVIHLVQIHNRPVLVGADAAGIKTIVPLPESFAQTLLTAEETGQLAKLHGDSALVP